MLLVVVLPFVSFTVSCKSLYGQGDFAAHAEVASRVFGRVGAPDVITLSARNTCPSGLRKHILASMSVCLPGVRGGNSNSDGMFGHVRIQS